MFIMLFLTREVNKKFHAAYFFKNHKIKYSLTCIEYLN